MLRVSDLSKHFGELPISENFDLRLPCKGFIVLIGPSGYDKSTLFNVLTGVVAKDSGEISWFDETISHLWDRSAYLQQKDLLLPWFSLMENALSPFVVASQAAPVFAIAPLLVVWLGYGIGSKVLMEAVIIFFPISRQL